MAKLNDIALDVAKKSYFREGEKDWEDLCIRVAENVAGVDSFPDTSKAIKYLHVMHDMKFIPNSPTLMNAGTPLQQLSACFVLPIEDSMEGIFEAVKNMAIVHKSGGGTGFSFSRLRGKGETVSTTGGEASGVLSFMEVFNTATNTVKQGGRRRGANMGMLHIDHPEIEDFIKVKEDKTRLTNFNLSVAVTDKFMETLKGIYETVKSAEEEGLSLPYNVLSDKQIRTYHLWQLMMQKAWESGEPGVVFIDAMNEANPTPQYGDFEATNPCFTGDTLVAVADGRNAVTIKELAEEGKDVPVFTYGDGGAKVMLGRFPRMTSKSKPVVKVTLDDGSSIKVTEDHKFILRNHDTVKAKDLKEGMSLLRYDKGFNNAYSTYIDNGELQSYYKICGQNEHKLIAEYTLGRPLEKYPKEICHHKNQDKFDNSPENIEVLSIAEHNTEHYTGVVFGHKNQNSKNVTTSDIVELFFQVIAEKQKMPTRKEFLTTMKSLSMGGREVIARVVGDYESLVEYAFLSGLYRDTKEYREADKRNVYCCSTGEPITVNVPKRKNGKAIVTRFFKDFWTYRKHIEMKEPATYCSERNKGIWYAKHARNILSILLEKGFDVSSYEEWDALGDKIENIYEIFVPSDIVKQLYPKFEDLVLATEVSNHKVVSVEPCGNEAVYNITVDKYHNVAIVTSSFVDKKYNPKGLTSYSGCFLTQCGEQPLLPYESCNLGSLNLSKFVSWGGEVDWAELKRVTEIAVEFLNDVIERNKYPIPEIEEATKRTRKIGLGIMGLHDALIKANLPYDSEEGREFAESIMSFIQATAKQASNGRNATVTTIAPTGTLSTFANVAGGIEPYFAKTMKRRYNDKEYDVPLAIFEEYLTQCDDGKMFYNEGVIKTADEIAPEDHVKMQASIQKYVDNAVSKTVNLPNSATVEDVENVFLLAYELGCKGTTVYRDGSRDNQTLTKATICDNCGSEMKASEGCFVCPSCGLGACKV